MNWLFIDKPGTPENLQVSDVYAEHCKLAWNPPTDDGGGEVTGKHYSVMFSLQIILTILVVFDLVKSHSYNDKKLALRVLF